MIRKVLSVWKYDDTIYNSSNYKAEPKKWNLLIIIRMHSEENGDENGDRVYATNSLWDCVVDMRRNEESFWNYNKSFWKFNLYINISNVCRAKQQTGDCGIVFLELTLDYTACGVGLLEFRMLTIFGGFNCSIQLL